MPVGRRKYRHRVSSKEHSQPKDYGTAERWQHSNKVLTLVSAQNTYVAKDVESEVLDFLLEHKLIKEIEYSAGTRLKNDFNSADMQPHVTGSYKPRCNARYNPYSSLDDRTDEQEFAYMRWRKALMALDIRYRNIIINAICYDQKPQNVSDVQLGLHQLHLYYLTH